VLDKLERLAEQYAKIKADKQQDRKAAGELAQVAIKIVDSISSPSFAFPVKKDALESSGTTTYTYENGTTYATLFDFLAELLHIKVPIEIEATKFDPGEILISKPHKLEADVELVRSTKELQKLVHARRSELSTRYSGAAAPP